MQSDILTLWGNACFFGIFLLVPPSLFSVTIQTSAHPLSQILGFEVKQRLKNTQAVTEAEFVTKVFIDRFGRFMSQNAHIEILMGFTYLTF